MASCLRDGLARYFKPEQLQLLASAKVGIAGAGGLGSNVAMMLARSGVASLVILDHDVVDASNLNRQHYWPDQLGHAKVDALARHIHALDDSIRLEVLKNRLCPDTVATLVRRAPLWVEAFDEAATKKMFVEKALLAGAKVVSASGVAGIGGAPMLKRSTGNLVTVGDFATATDTHPPLAPRVMQAAAMMADSVLEFILAPTLAGSGRD